MRLAGAAPSRWRRAALWGLVLAVLGVHGCVTQQVVERMADVTAKQGMPARIEVAYVREMVLATPPPPAAAPAAPPPVARARAPRPARKASEPEPATVVASADMPADAPNAPDAPEAPDAAQTAALAGAEPLPPPQAVAAASAAAEAASEPTSAAAVAAAAPASAAASAAAPAAFEWPASTRLGYLLTGYYRGEVSGSAQVEWVRAGARYQVHLDLVVGPSGAPLITRRMTSDGEITAQGLAPRRYDQDTKVILRDRNRATVLFEPGTVVLANGERRDSVPGLQDTASQFVQLTYVFSTRPDLLKVGDTVNIPLALPHKVDVWTYDVADEETLQTSFGALPTFHLKPRRKAERRAGELSAEIWFAPQLRYLPVRIRIEQDAGAFLDLMIDRRPEIAGS